MIRRIAVALEENRVFEAVSGNGDIPTEKVVEREARRGHSETNDVGIVMIQAMAHFGDGEIAA